MTNIIAEFHNGQWSAWFSDHPEVAFRGPLPSVAIARLLESRGLNPTRIAGRHGAATDTHLEFFIPSSACPDCRGSGRYTGLNMVTECGTCQGAGYV